MASEATPTAAVEHVLYLHGFRSAPQSLKARLTQEWLASHHPEVGWSCPQLPASPRASLALALEESARWAGLTLGVVGSSLGGFYATAVAAQQRCRAVLLNPAVDPARDLAAAVGRVNTAWHNDAPFDFRAEYVEELRAIAPAIDHGLRRRLLAIIAKGDEVLSWREMSERYVGCAQIVLPGGDHGLTEYPSLLPRAMAFLGLGGRGLPAVILEP